MEGTQRGSGQRPELTAGEVSRGQCGLALSEWVTSQAGPPGRTAATQRLPGVKSHHSTDAERNPRDSGSKHTLPHRTAPGPCPKSRGDAMGYTRNGSDHSGVT